MEGIAKLCILVGCLSILAGILLRITLFPVVIAGYAIIPRTFLALASTLFLLSISILMLKCSQGKKE